MQKEKSKETTDIKALYGKECTLPKEEFIKAFGINENGLTSAEAEARLQKYGSNQISGNKPKKWYNYFIESLLTPFNCILLRYCMYFILYRCLSCRKTKLCKYYCNYSFSNCKYFVRIL